MKNIAKTDHTNYNNIDCFKILMAIFVVAIHTHPETFIHSSIALAFIKSLYSIAVPFFFTASGFLIWTKIHKATTFEKATRIKEWIKKTLRLYLVWTIIFLPFTIYGFHIDKIGIAKSLAVFARNVLLVGENFMSWPLWYLLAVLIAATFIYLMVIMRIETRWMYVIAALMVIIGVALNYCHDKNFFPTLVNPYFKLFKSTRNGLFAGFPYIMIGISIANDGVIKSKKILGGILLGSFIAHMVGYRLATFVMTYALFSLAIQFDLPQRTDNLYKNCRHTSTIVYFVHMLFVGVFTLCLPMKLPNYILFLVVVVLSFITARIAIRYKDSKIVKFCFR